ncbi:SRPBCC domain-containing protein [Amycolatopsis pithecellobii]|uniref:SRPBCC domain-containing protein n=1 Tax=Amycolatopsis pithecellobii TaxID=664692 RepID=A0A6N7Z386_9PSEU|nr:SRPBCC domain-containing protein [Amycolatopsis pithecellobii]MTD56323.1 SRPBCC domain-containing protein [Amycolatopsis pithecellobii]
MSKEFSIEREVVLPATPEEVFAAVTTGTANWMFPTPAPDPGSPIVRNWEPPTRFTVRQDGEDGWFNALDFLIEARDGGTAALRYVHSGIFTDDWDNQYDGAAKHTDFYHHTLGEYLRYFGGKSAVYAEVSGPPASAYPSAMEAVRKSLGVSAVGDTVQLELPGLAPAEAVVDYLNPYFLGLRTENALYRVFGRNNFGGTVDISAHLFGEDADKERTEQALGAYLNGVFAA